MPPAIHVDGNPVVLAAGAGTIPWILDNVPPPPSPPTPAATRSVEDGVSA